MSPACDHDDCICQPLHTAKRGERMVVRHLHGDSSECHRLREMGFHEHAEVRLLRSGGSIVAQLQGAKICLSQNMAQSILVAAE